MRPRLALAVVVVVAVSVPMACSDDDGRSEPKVWVDDVCTAVGDWIVSFRQTVLDLEAEVSAAADTLEPEVAKSSLVALFESARDDTAEMVRVVADAGTPDVEGGDEVAAELKDTLTAIQQALDDARTAAEELDTTDQTVFGEQVLELAGNTEKALENIGDAYGDIQASAELRSAFAQSEVCSKLGG